MSFPFFQTCTQEDGYQAPSTLGLNADRPVFGIGNPHAALDATTALPSYLETDVVFEPIFLATDAAQAFFCSRMHPGHMSWMGASVCRPTSLYPDPPLVENLKPVKAIGVRVPAYHALELGRTEGGAIVRGPDFSSAGWHLKHEHIVYNKFFVHQEETRALSMLSTHDARYSKPFFYAGNYHPHPAQCRQLYGVLSDTYPKTTEVIVMVDLGEQEGDGSYLTQLGGGGVRVKLPLSMSFCSDSLEDDIQGGKLQLQLYLDDKVFLPFVSQRCRHLAGNRYRMTFIRPTKQEK